MSAWAAAQEGNENLLVRLTSPADAGLARTSASGSIVRQLPWLTRMPMRVSTRVSTICTTL